MLLSKSCEYGLRTALHLATTVRNGYVPIRAVSDALGIPYPFLAKIAQALIQGGLLDSTRGPHGGIRLARRADRIMLHEIVLVLDGPAVFEVCVLGLPDCGTQRPCPLHDQWGPARTQITALFQQTTLAELGRRVQDEGLRLADLTPSS